MFKPQDLICFGVTGTIAIGMVVSWKKETNTCDILWFDWGERNNNKSHFAKGHSCSFIEISCKLYKKEKE